MKKYTFAALAATLLPLAASAQIDIDVDLGKPEWYENPYIWVGVVVLLIIVLVLTRRTAK